MITFLVLLAASLGAITTYFLSVDLKKGPILASAASSLIFGLLCMSLENKVGIEISKSISLAFFGGSFVGMSSPTVIGTKKNVLLASFCFGAVFLLTKELFVGYGGGLGFRAMLSVLITLGVGSLLKKIFGLQTT